MGREISDRINPLLGPATFRVINYNDFGHFWAAPWGLVSPVRAVSRYADQSVGGCGCAKLDNVNPGKVGVVQRVGRKEEMCVFCYLYAQKIPSLLVLFLCEHTRVHEDEPCRKKLKSAGRR